MTGEKLYVLPKGIPLEQNEKASQYPKACLLARAHSLSLSHLQLPVMEIDPVWALPI